MSRSGRTESQPLMQQLLTELKNRLKNIHHCNVHFFELRAMSDQGPDVVVWRNDMLTVKSSMRSLAKLPGLVGFAVTKKSARFDIYDQHGTFVASETRTAQPLTPTGQEPRWDQMDAVAKYALARPHRIAHYFPVTGAAVSEIANYRAIGDILLMNGAANSMVIVADSNGCGGEALYVDLQTAPPAAQDAYLDNMRKLQNCEIVDWGCYDKEMLRAIQSYRELSFCEWLACAAGVDCQPEEVAIRLSFLNPEARHNLMVEALGVMLPHIVFFTGNPEAHPEEFDPDAQITLPKSALALFAHLE